MARYEITSPDGGRFEVTAPDDASHDQVLRYAQQQFATPNKKTDSAPVPQPEGAGRFASPKIADASPGIAEDMARGFGSGLVKGGIGVAALPGTVEQLGRMGINAAAKTFGGKTEDVVAPEPVLPSYGKVRSAVEKNITGPLYEPQTSPGKFAGAVGEFAPGIAFPGGNVSTAARVTRNVVAPAVASEGLGQITAGTPAEPYARIAGALAGPSFATPFRNDPVRQQLVNTLQNEGVTALTAGQRTGRQPLKWFESAALDTPGTGASAEARKTLAGEQFTQAALRRAGIDSPRATPDVMDDAFRRIGGVFDQVTQNNSAPVTRQLQNDASRIALAYERVVPQSMQSGVVRAIANDIQGAGPRGTIPGTTYQGWRSELDAAARSSSNPHVTRALYDMRNALDDAFQATLTGPELAAFQNARREYRNILVLERAAAGAGQDAALGIISPAQLSQATKTLHGSRNYVRGQGDFADLARAGQAIMLPLPQSGTAPRQMAMNAFKIAGGAAAGGYAAGGPEGSAAGAVAPFIAQAIGGRALMSRPMQAYLSNQLATGPALTAGPEMLARALMTSPQTAPELTDKRDLGLYGVVRR